MIFSTIWWGENENFVQPMNSQVIGYLSWVLLTHWGRVTHICISKLNIIGSDNGLSPGRRQAIIWTNAGILLIRPLVTNFSEIWIRIQTFSFKKMHLQVSSAKGRPFCHGLNVLRKDTARYQEWTVLLRLRRRGDVEAWLSCYQVLLDSRNS